MCIRDRQQTKEPTKGKEVTSGSAVVIDVKTGGILAIANYPSYDLNLYKTNYSAYSSDPNTPLLSRATTGLYAPGSTFKPTVALAGLLGGIVKMCIRDSATPGAAAADLCAALDAPLTPVSYTHLDGPARRGRGGVCSL